MGVEKYFALALDPIHIGTSGYRLGRVDNTIVRDPATNLPKIPGTSIEGCCRTYAYYEEQNNSDGFKKPNSPCATGKENACGRCRICVTFGYTNAERVKIKVENDDKEIPESLHGMTQFSDARILFFPVYSMLGPVWITSLSVLKEAGIKYKENGNEKEIPKVPKEEIIPSKELSLVDNRLNLGWILLEQRKENNSYLSLDFSKLECEGKLLTEVSKEFEEISKKLVIVSDDIFSQIVNSNLEVRTSVSINPETGAAEEGALFTYEAIPRGTVLWFEIVYLPVDKFECYVVYKEKDEEGKEKGERANLEKHIKPVVKNGLKLFETLGVGGMGTRGFGRLRILNLGNGEEDDRSEF